MPDDKTTAAWVGRSVCHVGQDKKSSQAFEEMVKMHEAHEQHKRNGRYLRIGGLHVHAIVCDLLGCKLVDDACILDGRDI